MKDKLLFVHIPKTGGTSVTESLMQSAAHNARLAISPYPRETGNSNFRRKRKHVTLVEYADYYNLSEYFVFSVVRNPYTRIFSHFRQYSNRNGYPHPLESFLEFINKTRPILEERANQRPCKLLDEDHTFVSNLHEVHTKVIPGTNQTMVGRDATPFIFFTQSYYMKNESGQIQVDKIYKNENFSELENDFNVKLVKVNVNRGNYTKEDYYKAYTPTAIDMVKNMYSEDFENFGYSTEFV